MKIGVALITAALGLAVTGIAQSQSNVEGSARERVNAGVASDGTPGAAAARASQAGQAAGGAQSQSGTLMFEEGSELNAELTRRIDAGRAEPGDEVRARVTEDVESGGRVVLEKGTRLYGRVVEAQAYDAAAAEAGGNAAAEARSQLAIVFEKAVVGRGQEIPMHATIQALAAAEGEMQSAGELAGSGARASQSGRAFGSASGGGGLVGGAGGVVGGGVGAVGSLGGGVGGRAGSASGVAGGAVAGAGSRVGGTVAGAGGAIYQSAGAVGGLDAAGRLGAGSRGVFGLDGLNIVSRGAANAAAVGSTDAGRTVAAARGAGSASAAGATIVTSASGNVRLDSGTRMLLVVSGSASGSASVSR